MSRWATSSVQKEQEPTCSSRELSQRRRFQVTFSFPDSLVDWWISSLLCEAREKFGMLGLFALNCHLLRHLDRQNLASFASVSLLPFTITLRQFGPLALSLTSSPRPKRFGLVRRRFDTPVHLTATRQPVVLPTHLLPRSLTREVLIIPAGARQDLNRPSVQWFITMPFFRFCDLSKEIRILVYEQCYVCTWIIIRNGRHSFLTDSCSRYTHEISPPLPQVCKLIRQEVLPIFAQSIEEVLVQSHGLSGVAPAYLTHVSEVALSNPDLPFVDERTIPTLHSLRICVTPDKYSTWVSGSSDDELIQDVLDSARKGFEGSRAHTELEERHSNESLPFSILLELQNLSYFEPDSDYVRYWSGVMVDWEKQEIVGGWPPPRSELNDWEPDNYSESVLSN